MPPTTVSLRTKSHLNEAINIIFFFVVLAIDAEFAISFNCIFILFIFWSKKNSRKATTITVQRWLLKNTHFLPPPSPVQFAACPFTSSYFSFQKSTQLVQENNRVMVSVIFIRNDETTSSLWRWLGCVGGPHSSCQIYYAFYCIQNIGQHASKNNPNRIKNHKKTTPFEVWCTIRKLEGLLYLRQMVSAITIYINTRIIINHSHFA